MLGVARAGHGSSRKGLRMGETRGGEGERLGNRRRGGESGHWEKVKIESIMGKWLFLAFEME